MHYLTSFAEVEKRHSSVECFDVERIVSNEMTFDIFEVFANRVGFAEYPRFADTSYALVGFYDAVG